MYCEPIPIGDWIIGLGVLTFCGWYILTHWNNIFPK